MIEIKDYDITIKGNVVLNGVNLTLEQGDVALVTGANGSGKTLLLRALNKNEQKITNTFEQIGVVIEKSKLIPHMTGRDFLYFLNKLEGKNEQKNNERADELIEYFHLEQYKNNRISSYSLGTTHKFALIQAFMHSPSLILLDEPYDSLDKQAIKLLTNLISYQVSQGVSFVIVDHNEEKIMQMIEFNKWFEIDNGKLIARQII